MVLFCEEAYRLFTELYFEYTKG